MRVQIAIVTVAAAWAGVARAEHTAEDARRTSAKLDAIRRAAYAPPKKARPEPRAEARAERPARQKAEPATERRSEPTSERRAERRHDDADPMWSMIGHAMAIPFDEKEREAHFRDLPKTKEEIDAHLRRLDAALKAQHQHR